MSILFDSLWPGLTVWILLYISDYAFTIVCARLYRAGVSEKIHFDGSYEITPYFQRDIDSLRLISPRFVAALIGSAFLLGWVWFLASQSQRGLYAFPLGAMVVLQMTIHIRHLRNFFTSALSIRVPSCASAAIKHLRLARRVPLKAAAAVQPQSTF